MSVSAAPKNLIDGVEVKKLKVLPDGRGRLMEMVRSDDPFFTSFGQVYMTSVYPGVVKGWHYHKKQVDHFVCVQGMVKVVLYDGRKDSPTSGAVNEFFMGVHQPILLRIPPFVLHGMEGIGDEEALIINVSSELYHYDSPDEFRVDPHSSEIPYVWGTQDG
ncbi:MAG: dTDP-4-dehydrorhamnose 3,5-epimerase family protein [Candidatus Omnitrophica bacterium]|nr:dTDP-4-dehydrorhamnose 3,5-epimerase family protein [Candidatus Omnitrophota bacterium]